MKETVFLFDKHLTKWPGQFVTSLNNLGTPFNIILGYTILWVFLTAIAGYDSRIIKSVIVGYICGIVIIGCLLITEQSRYWIRTDKDTNETIYFKAPSNLNSYNVITKNNGVFKDNDLNKGGVIVEADKYEEYIKNHKLEAEKYGEYAQKHILTNVKRSDYLKEHQNNSTMAFNLAQIILSIGLLTWNNDPSTFKVIYPWIIIVLVFSVFIESVWVWANTSYSEAKAVNIKMLSLVMGYAVSISVVSMVLQLI